MAKILDLNLKLILQNDWEIYFANETDVPRMTKKQKKQYNLIKEFKNKVDDLCEWVNDNYEELPWEEEYGDFYQWLLYHIKHT